MKREIIKNLPNIIEGATNDFLGVNEELVEKRMKVCEKCPKKGHSPILGDICEKCGCKLAFKLSLPYLECPLKKWLAE